MCIEYVWNVIPKETPVIEKNCSRCGNNGFVCSEKFRINSNKKMSDVWLIYKCACCESTWNMSILERKNLSLIDHDLFCQFQENNIDLVWRFAFDKSIAKVNKVRINGSLAFDVDDQGRDFLQSNKKTVSILILSKYELSISVKKVIQQKFNFSGNQVERLSKENIIAVNGGANQDISKKIGFNCSIVCDVEAWKRFGKN